jgi:hypothetical protein
MQANRNHWAHGPSASRPCFSPPAHPASAGAYQGGEGDYEEDRNTGRAYRVGHGRDGDCWRREPYLEVADGCSHRVMPLCSSLTQFGSWTSPVANADQFREALLRESPGCCVAAEEKYSV